MVSKEFVHRCLENVAIVLVEPKYPENIGAAARSAANMGIRQLIVVRDELPEEERMRKMATHHAGHLLDSLMIFPRLADALAPFHWVVGTSARQGRQRRLIVSPGSMVAGLLPKIENNRVALVFGPEDRGLTNDHLKLCNVVTTIPTADFSSLNLAQAVAILSYELYAGLIQAKSKAAEATTKLANSEELEGMYGQIEQALRTMDRLKETDYGYWMHNIRQFLSRIGLRSREVKFVKGFCRQVSEVAGKIRRHD